LRKQLEDALEENNEQARLLGAGGSREAKLLSDNDRLRRELINIKEVLNNSKNLLDQLKIFNKKIGKITANVNEKIMDKKYLKQEIINKDMDPNLFFLNQEFVRVKITKADNIKDVEEFQKLFSKLLTLYDNKFQEIYNYYSEYTNISEPEKITEEVRKEKSLKDIVPELFLPKYTRICRKPPTIIENDEENSKNLPVMIFPKSDKEGTMQRKYICNYDKTMYPGVRDNPHANADKFPVVPCCYDKPQTSKPKFLQYFVNWHIIY
jgi:hypothetical protein